MLQAFFRDLDATVGKDNYIAVLTADHGFMPAPEVSQARGLDAGRISCRARRWRGSTPSSRSASRQPKLAPFTSASALVLDKKLIAQKGLDVRHGRRAPPAISSSPSRASPPPTPATEIASRSRAGAPFFDADAKAWHAEVSGDIQVVAEAELDVHLELGEHHARVAASLRHERADPVVRPRMDARRAHRQRVEVVDIAPTLSALLGVAAPAASEGKPLPLGAR